MKLRSRLVATAGAVGALVVCASSSQAVARGVQPNLGTYHLNITQAAVVRATINGAAVETLYPPTQVTSYGICAFGGGYTWVKIDDSHSPGGIGWVDTAKVQAVDGTTCHQYIN